MIGPCRQVPCLPRKVQFFLHSPRMQKGQKVASLFFSTMRCSFHIAPLKKEWMITKGGAPSSKQNNANGDARQGNHYIMVHPSKISSILGGCIFGALSTLSFVLLLVDWFFLMYVLGETAVCLSLRSSLSLLTVSPLLYKTLSFVYRIKNRNLTQKCGEKQNILLVGYMIYAMKSSSKHHFCLLYIIHYTPLLYFSNDCVWLNVIGNHKPTPFL